MVEGGAGDGSARPATTRALDAARAGLARAGGLPGIGRWFRTATGAVSAGVTLVLGVLSLIFLIWPALRPESGSTALGATLSDARLERAVSLGEVYTRRGETPPATYSAAQLETDGVLLGVTVTIEGYAGKACDLRWSLFDAERGARVDDARYQDQQGWPDGVFRPVAARDQANGEVWIPSPGQPGNYLIRLELFDPGGQRLTTIDSPSFAVAAGEIAPTATATGQSPPPGGL